MAHAVFAWAYFFVRKMTLTRHVKRLYIVKARKEVRDGRMSLVSVETQEEYSIDNGKKEKRIFLKMYVDAVRSGLIADMGPKNWTTLCVIASFMDENGNCYPTQDQIAKGLGVSRQTANKYIQDLLNYRWQGKPVIRVIKEREHGRFKTSRYTVLPISNLEIFNHVKDHRHNDYRLGEC